VLKKAKKRQNEKEKLQRARARVERLRAKVAGLKARSTAVEKARASNHIISWAYLKTNNCLKSRLNAPITIRRQRQIAITPNHTILLTLYDWLGVVFISLRVLIRVVWIC
jgi:hypothetical protein